MDNQMEKIFMERIDALDGKLNEDAEYVRYGEQYHYWMEELKNLIKRNHEDKEILMRLDEAVGNYSSRYGEVLYNYAFHDGLEVGMNHEDYNGKDDRKFCTLSVEDMIHLIYIYDAYNILCDTLVGTVLAPGMRDGIIGAFSRIHTVVEKHISPKLKNGDNAVGHQILDDTTKEPEERAKILMEIN
ncbi:MAG: hypothetical protein IJ733_20700 [Lachnospiraceae bacterium]|nr:hypothetical protein [Lachnospiraceae bacterium]